MRCCKNLIDTLFKLCCVLALLMGIAPVWAEGIEINKVEARLSDDGYLLSADFNIQLPPSVEDALKRGITLYFVSELSVRRSRWYWIDTDVAKYEQTSKLSYNTLTQQFRISRGGLFQSFYELKDALRILGHLSASAIPASQLESAGGGYFSRLIKKGVHVEAYTSMRLDLGQLPKPLQVNALTNDQWTVESGRYRWEIGSDSGGSEGQP